MADDPLRVGLVGAGVIGQLAHLPVLSRRSDVQLAGLVTGDPGQTEENLRRWPIAAGYESLTEMIEGADLDAVLVLTPKHLHAPFVIEALEAGLDVFSEKPLASDLSDAGSLVDAADRAKGLLMVGFNRRYAEVYRTARAAFADRPPRVVVAQKHRTGSEYRATLENGIHMLDLLRWFCGEAVDVQAHSWAPDKYEEEGAAALIRFDSGSTAVFAAACCAGEWDERLDAYGEFSSVRVVAPDQVSVVRDGVSTVTEMRPRAKGWADITESAGFAPCLDHFLQCVRTRAEPMTNAVEAYRSQELMQELLAAAGLPTEDRAA